MAKALAEASFPEAMRERSFTVASFVRSPIVKLTLAVRVVH